MSQEPGAAIRVEWHEVLLRLAGWLSDNDLFQARESLAEGGLDRVAYLIRDAISAGLVPYSAEDAARLQSLLAAHGVDPSLVEAGVRQSLEPPPWGFAPVPPWGIGPSVTDAVDQAAIDAAADSPVTTLTRVWRYPPTALQVPRRIYLAETTTDADLPVVTHHLHSALVRAGEPTPQVEVYTAESRLPEYHRSAISQAEPLWPTQTDAE
ncbi:hypothetical protein [Actinoallomurus sp. CA-150999]|uniref:hypothetical protein n=1 Tax=Actinoallomurus sp. CA-150999 TaxID=3239887 RepID=UPI003D908DC9